MGALCPSQNGQSNGSAGLGIGQCVVVVAQVVAAAGGYNVEVVVAARPAFAGGHASAKEGVVGVIHLVRAEHGLQATLVEGLVVRHQGQSLDERLYLPPHGGEDGGLRCVGGAEAVHAAAPVVVVFGLGLDERVKPVGYLSAAHHHDAHGAHRRALVVGRFKVYGCEVLHVSFPFMLVVDESLPA